MPPAQTAVQSAPAGSTEFPSARPGSLPSSSAGGGGGHTPPGPLAALLRTADIRIGGHRPWDIRIHRPRVYRRILSGWSLGLGESYMDGDWDCDQLDELFTRLLRHRLDERVFGVARLRLAMALLAASTTNPQSAERAFVVGEHHYDLGNDLYERMLDPRMVYSCGFWEAATTLAQAQEHKLELICRKLQLRPGMTLLDIGCGWGGLARHAAERHGVRVTGITVSREQQAYARQACSGLPVEIRLQDYRRLEGRYDRVASVGMFEHVGPRNHADFFEVAQRLLAPDGLFLLHTIGVDRPSTHTDPWIEKYIFPGGKLPAASELAAAAQQRFVIEDWHNFGPDYDRTLMAWHRNFEAGWPGLEAHYGERFLRMWRYYLLSCAGFFRSRQGQLWQLVLSRAERPGVYRSVRASVLNGNGAASAAAGGLRV